MAGINHSDEFIREFLFDSTENLNRLDNDLLALEKEPASREILASIFRSLHTIKGSSGMLGFARLEAVTHAGENLLSRLRDRQLSTNSEIIEALLQLVDTIRRVLKNVEATQKEGEIETAALVEKLQRLQKNSESPADAARTTGSGARKAVPAAGNGGDELDPRSLSVEETSIRVDVVLLDKLMNLVGELVLARNQMLQLVSSHKDASLAVTGQRLNLITTELQEGVMKTRMQPIGNIWNKFPRVVRDLAVACGKKVRLETEGESTELDRTIVEAIKDPLTHIVRNALDHGLETPAQRRAVGKPEEGRLRLVAFHEGGQVNIEVSDDGAGIDSDRIREKAVARGLFAQEQAARLSHRDIVNLIFMPGFSTAEKVTRVSGRGVGMDVVKTNIEKIGGTVDVLSQPGVGTTIKLKIPLTLAIIPALIVTCAGDRYAIPQVSLIELVRLEGDAAKTGIERIHDSPVCRLRGNLLPLVFLRKELGLGDSIAPEGDSVNIIVLQCDGRNFGLVVESINDTEDIVVKPLGKQLKGILQFSGATIMGDGRVALILDAMGLAQNAHVVGKERSKLVGSKKEETAAERPVNVRTLLLFEGEGGGRMAIPLSQVARLEEIATSAIERVGSQDMIQYRNEILPLVYLDRVLHRLDTRRAEAPAQKRNSHSVVVYSHGGRSMGVVVERVIDIVEEALDLNDAHRRACVMGTSVIQDRITEIIDLESVVHAAGAPAAPVVPGAQQPSAGGGAA